MTEFGAVRRATALREPAEYAPSAVMIEVIAPTDSRNIHQCNVKKRGQFNAGAEFR
jgi:hypothetical protein